MPRIGPAQRHLDTTLRLHSRLLESEDTLVLEADDPLTATDEGTSFVFASGLGGKSVRDQKQLPTAPWWEAVYTSNQGVPGAPPYDRDGRR